MQLSGLLGHEKVECQLDIYCRPALVLVVCVLLNSAIGDAEFWADALKHVTWLYNCTYHSAIDMTPLQAYTGQVPALDSLITFGSKITAKRPG